MLAWGITTVVPEIMQVVLELLELTSSRTVRSVTVKCLNMANLTLYLDKCP